MENGRPELPDEGEDEVEVIGDDLGGYASVFIGFYKVGGLFFALEMFARHGWSLAKKRVTRKG